MLLRCWHCFFFFFKRYQKLSIIKENPRSGSLLHEEVLMTLLLFCVIYYDTIILFVFHIHVVLRKFNKVMNSLAACVCTIIWVRKRKKKTFHPVPGRYQHNKFVASQDFVLGKSDCVTTYKINIFSMYW